jgi:Nif-specific regulatory protein
MEKNRFEYLQLLNGINSLLFETFSNFNDFFAKIISGLINYSNAGYGFIFKCGDNSYDIMCNEGIETNEMYQMIEFLQTEFKSSTNKLDPVFIENEIFNLNNKKVKNILIPLSIIDPENFVKVKPEYVKNGNYLVFLGDVSKSVLSKFKEEDFIKTVTLQISYNMHKITLFNELNRKIKLKEILIEISNDIERVFNLKNVFDIVMKKLADEFSVIRGMLVLFDKNHMDNLSVFSAYNLTEREISRGIYKAGEGIIGRVVDSGKSISITDINQDKYFLNRMQIKRDKNIPISFIAVPIKISGVVGGVIAIEKIFQNSAILKDDEDLLFLIGRLIENKVEMYQKMKEERSVLLEENKMLKNELHKNYGISNFIGKTPEMLKIFAIINMIADNNSSVMLTGESGTGKELAARSIHFNGSRKNNAFISVNCSASNALGASSIPGDLLEHELFGYEKETFTWTGKEKKGKLLLADNGTLFLDEIGDIPLYIQAKLLKTVQDGEFEPLGSDVKVKINIRFISATNRDPRELIKSGKLREDLYYKLNIVEIELPQLKKRKEDIPLLVQYFIDKYSIKNDRNVSRISQESLKILQNYDWPGNVRELENIIEKAVILSTNNILEPHNLPSFIIKTVDYKKEEPDIGKWMDGFLSKKDMDNLMTSNTDIYNDFMRITEKELIVKSLLLNNRNKFKTAKFLGINRNTLRSKMKQYDITI